MELKIAAIWERLMETMKSAITQLCQDQRIVHNLTPDYDQKRGRISEYEQRLNNWAEELSEKIIKRMEQESELEKILQMFMSYPSEAMVAFARLYAKNFRECAMEGVIKDHTEELIERSVKKGLQFMKEVTQTERTIKEAIEAGEYKRAEIIIRGKMAMSPAYSDIEILNQLFTIACLSGNADLLVETLNLGNSQPNFLVIPGLVDKEIIAQFLNKTVAENIIVEADPLLQVGLFTGMTRFSASQEEEIRGVVEKIISQAVDQIVGQLASSQEWTREGLLDVCRSAISEKCETCEKFLVGKRFYVQWKGEKIPDCMKGRFQQI
jgi:hypothetical protein